LKIGLKSFSWKSNDFSSLTKYLTTAKRELCDDFIVYLFMM
jgi:hypothetical protein